MASFTDKVVCRQAVMLPMTSSTCRKSPADHRGRATLRGWTAVTRNAKQASQSARGCDHATGRPCTSPVETAVDVDIHVTRAVDAAAEIGRGRVIGIFVYGDAEVAGPLAVDHFIRP